MTQIRIAPGLSIDDDDIEERFVLATGPGGQNVNKVASAVQLRYAVHGLPETIRARLMLLAGRRLTKDGVLVLTANQYRDQVRNRADARARLIELIRAAAVVPKKRRATKPPRGAKENRLQRKKKHAELKRGRGKPREE